MGWVFSVGVKPNTERGLLMTRVLLAGIDPNRERVLSMESVSLAGVEVASLPGRLATVNHLSVNLGGTLGRETYEGPGRALPQGLTIHQGTLPLQNEERS